MSAGFPIQKLQSRVLHLHVFDYDRFSRDDSIGEVFLPLCQVREMLAHFGATFCFFCFVKLMAVKAPNTKRRCSIVFVFSPGRAIPDASYWLAAAANQNRSGKKDGRRSICVSRCCCPPFLCFFYFQCFDRQLQISCVSILFCVVCSTL